MSNKEFDVLDEGQEGTGDIESVSVDGSYSFLPVYCGFHVLLCSHYYHLVFIDHVVEELIPKAIVIGGNDNNNGSGDDKYNDTANDEPGTAATTSFLSLKTIPKGFKMKGEPY